MPISSKGTPPKAMRRASLDALQRFAGGGEDFDRTILGARLHFAGGKQVVLQLFERRGGRAGGFAQPQVQDVAGDAA